MKKKTSTFSPNNRVDVALESDVYDGKILDTKVTLKARDGSEIVLCWISGDSHADFEAAFESLIEKYSI